MTEAYDGGGRRDGPAPAPQRAGADDRRRPELETVRVSTARRRCGRRSPRRGEPACGAGGRVRVVSAADVLEAAGAEVHLAHPLGVKAYSYRRVRTMSGAARPGDLLRMGRLPRPDRPREIRELRELTRYRHSWSSSAPQSRTRCTRAGQARHRRPVQRHLRVRGSTWLNRLDLPQPYAGVASLRQLAGTLTSEITLLDKVLSDLLDGHQGYQAIQALPGIGPCCRSDRRRDRRHPPVPRPGQLGSSASLTPRALVRPEGDPRARDQAGLADTALSGHRGHPAPARRSRPPQVKDAIIARRGKKAKNIAKIAAARELLTLVFYGMRDCASAAPPGSSHRRPHDRPRARRAAASYSAPRHRREPPTFCPPPGPAAIAVRPGGAGARLIGPARPLTRTRPMPPGTTSRRDKRRDQCSQRAAQPDDRPWGRTQPHTQPAPQGDPPRSAPDYRRAAARVKDASSAYTADSPVPDTGPLLARTRTCAGKESQQASQPRPANHAPHPKPHRNPLDTAAPSGNSYGDTTAAMT